MTVKTTVEIMPLDDLQEPVTMTAERMEASLRQQAESFGLEVLSVVNLGWNAMHSVTVQGNMTDIERYLEEIGVEGEDVKIEGVL